MGNILTILIIVKLKKKLVLLGHVIGAQLMDVCIRVQAIRPFAVAEMAQLLDVYSSTSQFSIMQEVLYAAAWLTGEFVRLV